MMSRALAEIWPEDEATWTEASWMLSTTLRRFATISFRLRPSVPTSSSPSASIFTSRSPFATCSDASAIACSGPSQRPASAQPTAEPRPTSTSASSSASNSRRRCTARSARWLIATSTPPFTDSGGGGRRPELLAERRAAAGGRDRRAEQQHRLAVGREGVLLLERRRRRPGQVADRLAGLGEDLALGVADHGAHHVRGLARAARRPPRPRGTA